MKLWHSNGCVLSIRKKHIKKHTILRVEIFDNNGGHIYRTGSAKTLENAKLLSGDLKLKGWSYHNKKHSVDDRRGYFEYKIKTKNLSYNQVEFEVGFITRNLLGDWNIPYYGDIAKGDSSKQSQEF